MADYTLEKTELINVYKIFYLAWPGGLDGWVVSQSSTKSQFYFHMGTQRRQLIDAFLSLSVSPTLCLSMPSLLTVNKHILR